MPRIQPIDPQTAQGKTRQLLDGMQNTLGMIPNIMRTLANAPAALEAYTGLIKALEGTRFDGRTREAIALLTSAENGCEYCAAAHTALGKMHGLAEQEMRDNLQGRSSDPARAAVLQFARAVIEKRGWVDDDDVNQARQAGLGDREITEIVATVAVTTFSTYFNHVAQTEVDFPAVKLNAREAA